MTGTNESATIKLVSLEVSEAFTHFKYINQMIFNSGDSGFDIPFFFVAERINPSLDKITLSIKICLRDKKKGTRIAGFTLKSVYYVGTGLCNSMKLFVLSQILNQIMCNATGVWTVQFRNKNICAIIPQGYNKFLEDQLMLKKTVDEWK
ncbi:MAG: hypothetical protein WCL14_01560 [Bacteroidota bacterium]